MKNKEEIEQLADDYVNHKPKNVKELRDVNLIKMGYIKGYTQCQEYVGDKRYTEEDVINLMFMATKWDTFKDGDVEYEMDMDDFFKYLINSLNKQGK